MVQSTDDTEGLEALWDQLLSRQIEQIRLAYAGLAPNEQSAVLAHLKRMAEEPGWHAEQRASAQAALNAIRKDAGVL